MTDTDDTAAALTEAERRALISAAQQCLTDGETGMAPGDCNRAGWHVGSALTTVVERILTARLAAQPPQDDPQPDEAGVLFDAIHGARNSEGGLVVPTLPASRLLTAAVLAAGFRRDPDAGLRKAVLAALVHTDPSQVQVRVGGSRSSFLDGEAAMAHRVRAALAEPTPGSESP